MAEKQEGFEPVENIESFIQPLPEGAMPSEIVNFLSFHIDNPCEAEVALGVFENIRGFYLRLAKEALPKIKENEFAHQSMLLKIQEYEPDYKPED